MKIILDIFKYVNILNTMKLTLQIKLLPDKVQIDSLTDTLKEANSACNKISQVAWEHKIFNQYKLHRLVYRQTKDTSQLSAQAVVRCISKVVDAYKLDKKKKRTFKPLGGIAYDSRILSYKTDLVSIWSVDGRVKIPFICHNVKYLPYIKGEADLVTKRGKWFLFQTVEVPEDDIINVEDFIGVDFGIVNIATLSSGEKLSGEELKQYRIKRQKIRSSLQSKGTKGSKKTLKRLSGREQRTASIVNHTIAKQIVETAINERKGIVLENLKGIRRRANNKGKAFRSLIGRWNFSQLRGFIEYKAKQNGIPVVLVNPAYTSQMCSSCFCIGSRNGESFKCTACGYIGHADINAARNIRQVALPVNQGEQSVMCCVFPHNQVESRLL